MDIFMFQCFDFKRALAHTKAKSHFCG